MDYSVKNQTTTAPQKADASLNKQGEQSATVTCSVLNVRSGPGTTHNRLGKLYQGNVVKVLGEKNGWLKISFSGQEAWISKEFTKAGGKVSASSQSASTSKQNPSSASKSLQRAIDFAKSQVGKRNYVKKTSDGKTMTYCQAFVADCAEKVLGKRVSRESAKKAEKAWSVSKNKSNIPVGAAIYFNSTTTNGRKHGHVGFHIGNNVVCHVGGPVKQQTLSEVTASGTFSFSSWGWNGGKALS